MNYNTAIELLSEDTIDVKKFNLYRNRTKKVGRRNELNPADVNTYLNDLEPVFDADVYNEMSEDEILEDIAAYFDRMRNKPMRKKDYKII